MTGFADVERDLGLSGLASWGIFSVETADWLFESGSLKAYSELNLAEVIGGDWADDAILLVTPTTAKVLGNGTWDSSWMLDLVEELQSLAMDSFRVPFPSVVIEDKTFVPEPLSPSPGLVQWVTTDGRKLCDVGNLGEFAGLIRTSR